MGKVYYINEERVAQIKQSCRRTRIIKQLRLAAFVITTMLVWWAYHDVSLSWLHIVTLAGLTFMSGFFTMDVLQNKRGEQALLETIEESRRDHRQEAIEEFKKKDPERRAKLVH